MRKVTNAASYEERTPPPTAKGRKTRDELLVAARAVFEKKSFIETRVADIVREAGLSHGSFYTYFDSKDHVFWEIIGSVTEAMYNRPADPPAERGGPRRGTFEYHARRIERGTRQILETFRDNAAMIRVLEEVATYNDAFKELRRAARQLFVDRAERGIIAVQEAKLANPDFDSRYAANALASMVDRFAYMWFVLGVPFEFEKAVETLSTLWMNAIEMSPTKWKGRRVR